MAVSSKVTFEIDGVLIRVGANLSVEPEILERTTESGLSGVVGYSEMPVAPAVEGEFFLLKGENMNTVTDATEVTLFVDSVNHSYVMKKAYKVGKTSISLENNRFTARFEANNCTPVAK